jgi:GT2 family glycosyltransferase
MNEAKMSLNGADKKTTDVTVVIPNYNGLDYLKRCLRSLWTGTLLPLVYVVDNGSKDGSVLWVREHYPTVKLIEMGENTGFCCAVNAGIKAADTDYVILLNNDTVVGRHFVAELLGTIRPDERIFSVGAKMVTMDAPDIIDDAGDYYCALGWAFAWGKGQPADRYTKARDIFAACAGAAIYRKRMVEELGYFDEAHFAYLEDIDIGYRAQLAGYINRFTPRAVVRHAGSGASGSRYNDFKTDMTSRNSVYLIYKNMPIGQIILNLPLLMIGFGVKWAFFVRKGMGRGYLKGLWKGVLLSSSPEGRAKKVFFQRENLSRYLSVQGQLYVNIIRRFIS